MKTARALEPPACSAERTGDLVDIGSAGVLTSAGSAHTTMPANPITKRGHQ